jgi:hypothetical protein
MGTLWFLRLGSSNWRKKMTTYYLNLQHKRFKRRTNLHVISDDINATINHMDNSGYRVVGPVVPFLYQPSVNLHPEEKFL